MYGVLPKHEKSGFLNARNQCSPINDQGGGDSAEELSRHVARYFSPRHFSEDGLRECDSWVEMSTGDTTGDPDTKSNSSTPSQGVGFGLSKEAYREWGGGDREGNMLMEEGLERPGYQTR